MACCILIDPTQTFVAQTQEDLATFNRLIVDTGEALGRRIRVNSWYRPRPDFAEPTMSPEDVSLWGPLVHLLLIGILAQISRVRWICLGFCSMPGRTSSLPERYFEYAPNGKL